MSSISLSVSGPVFRALPHVPENGCLQPAEAEVEIPFHVRRVPVGVGHARRRERDGFVVAVPRALVDNRPARVSESQQLGDLVVRLPCRIIPRSPDAFVAAGFPHHVQARVASRNDERHERQGDVAVLKEQRFDVPGEVVHRHERSIERKRERLGEGDADEQRTDETGALRDGNRVELFQIGLSGLQCRADHAADIADVLTRRKLGHHAAPLAVDVHLRRDDVRSDRPPAAGFRNHGRRRLVARRFNPQHQHMKWLTNRGRV